MFRRSLTFSPGTRVRPLIYRLLDETPPLSTAAAGADLKPWLSI
jgi:hypothetical protein